MQLPIRLTLAEAPTALATLRTQLESAGAAEPWVLDAAALEACDTSALAVLLELQRLAAARGVRLAVEQPPAKLRQLAALYGVEGLLGLGPDELQVT